MSKASIVRKMVKGLVDEAPEMLERFAAKEVRPVAKVTPKPAPKPPRRDLAKDVLAEAAVKKTGKDRPTFTDWRKENEDKIGGMFDYSRLSVRPSVPQTQMKRTVPPRGPSQRMQDTLGRVDIRDALDNYVRRGTEMGGLEWYNTMPMLERSRGLMGGEGDLRHGMFMDAIAATSPGSRISDNIRTASYYNYLRSLGEPVPGKPAPGYGSKTQNLHMGNMQALYDGGFDIFKNPKPASFAENLKGNWQNVTVDKHNMRLPAMLSEDPRMLATSSQEKVAAGGDPMASLRRRFPGLSEESLADALAEFDSKGVVRFRPRRWVESGEIPMSAARDEPILWSKKPQDNEYGFYEGWQQDRAKEMGLDPAQYQAAMWVGAGDKTGLGSTPEPFLRTFEARVRYTADRLGVDPETVLDAVLKGETPLLARGGSVDLDKLGQKYGED